MEDRQGCMNTITINKPHLCTKLPIWAPKYSEKYAKYGEEVVLVHRTKVAYASPVIIIEFTKAKHLLGQRFCIRKDVVMRCDIGSNGAAVDNMYIVPFSKLDTWQTGAEVHALVMGVFDD